MAINKLAIFRTALLIAAVNIAWLQIFAEAAETAEQGWLLKQKSKVCGDVSVLLLPRAMKLTDERTNTTVVSSAPDWTVVVYNRSNKTRFSCPLEKFHGFARTGVQLSMGFTFGGIPLVKQSITAKVLGEEASIYRSSPDFEKSSRAMFIKGTIGGGAPWTAKLLAARNWHLPPQESKIMCRLYGFDDTAQIPLDFHCLDQQRDDKEGLKTVAISRNKIAAGEFAVPAGYRPVESLEAVRLDAAGQSAMEDMVRNLDHNLDVHDARKHK